MAVWVIISLVVLGLIMAVGGAYFEAWIDERVARQNNPPPDLAARGRHDGPFDTEAEINRRLREAFFANIPEEEQARVKRYLEQFDLETQNSMLNIATTWRADYESR